jgi:hypothetical protein
MNALALKRVGVAAAVPVLLAVPGLLLAAAPAGAGAANAPAVKGIGTLNCGTTGKIKFIPALGASSTPTAIKVVITLIGCSGSNAGATVSGGHITGTLTGTPAGDCAASAVSTTGTLTVTYVVKPGHPSLRASTLSFNQVQSFSSGTSFQGEVTGAVTAGSFFNNGSFLDLQATQSSPCGAKWSAGAGSTFEEG